MLMTLYPTFSLLHRKLPMGFQMASMAIALIFCASNKSRENHQGNLGHWTVHSNAHFLAAKVRMVIVLIKTKSTKYNKLISRRDIF